MDKSRLRVLNPQIENSEPLQFKGKRKGCEFSTYKLRILNFQFGALSKYQSKRVTFYFHPN